MADPVNPPELIISLSRDKVRLELFDQDNKGLIVWTSTYSVQGLFLEDQLAEAMDAALVENPFLVEHFRDVSIILIDRPNVCVPDSYADENKLPEIAGRYLRVGPGDKLAADTVRGDLAIAYALPNASIDVLQEYYAHSETLHLTSLLWNAITELVSPADKGMARLFFYCTGNTLLIIGQTDGKLSFSKCFYIHEQSDLTYFAIACIRLLKPQENWLLTLKDESRAFELAGNTHLKFDQQLELPALHHLIARHGSCVS